ncbi:MAG: glycine/betaine ABC transporter substrate-binding protein [Oceanospirillaceae bacterium]|nr:glycine/betaine ABC transporter substrate-binding protein [Oceanospirillaceae bacterium]
MNATRKTLNLTLALGLAGTLSAGAAFANDHSCQQVTLSGPGWTDIAATNGVTEVLLDTLGYDAKVETLAVPIGFEGLKSGEVDLFLGNWMPAQQKFIDKYGDSIDIVGTNLTGAKFTLAVPKYVHDAGITDFADLQTQADKFRSRIYGIEAGAPANQLLQKMIDSGDFNLSDWQLVESGEQGVMSQVRRAIRRDQFIVFLGWEPHPMNSTMEIAYLTGGDDYFGPDFGGATVRTLTRKGYSEACPNVGQLLQNMTFTLDMENQIMGYILDDGMKPAAAAQRWLAANPAVLDTWLDGITTLDGKPATPVVKSALESL